MAVVPSDADTNDEGVASRRRDRKTHLKAMVDCEFLGDRFDDDILAISIVLFERPARVMTNVQQAVKGSITVRTKLPTDWESRGSLETVHWFKSTVPGLLAWLKSPGAFPPREAAVKVADFVRRVQSKHRVWWMAKPSFVDLGRMCAWMCKHLGSDAPTLGFHGSCL